MARDTDALYIGSAGELHVMAEFLVRGYNVAVPKVDIGDDVLVIKDHQHEIRRVQVKTARPAGTLDFQFLVSRQQLETPDPVALWYVFLARRVDRWLPPLLIEQEVLRAIQEDRTRKAEGGRDINFTLRFPTDNQAFLGSRDLSKHLDDWQAWPSILATQVAVP